MTRILKIFGPHPIFGIGEAMRFKFGVQIDIGKH